jgi:hypothetical protein
MSEQKQKILMGTDLRHCVPMCNREMASFDCHQQQKKNAALTKAAKTSEFGIR